MKSVFAACLGLALLAGLSSPGLVSGAELRPRVTYVYYSVPYSQGLSAPEMILRHSPLTGKGRSFAGYTHYNINYEVNYSQPTIDVCRVESPQVTCDCEITLPRLEGGESDPELRRLFAAELSRITRHEQTHCDIAVRHAQSLLTAIGKLKDMPCREADKSIAARFKKITDDCRVDQTRFDHAEYGYKDHLRLDDPQPLTDEGFKASPETGPGRGGRTGDLRSISPPSDQEFKQTGIYKDENGVWRNY